MQRYRIFGRAFPERRSWWFDPVKIQTEDSEGTVSIVRAQMTDSQFTASLDIRESHAPPDAHDAKVALESIVRTVLDTIGLFHGCAVDCEVVLLELPDGETVVLDSRFDGLAVGHTPEEFRTVSLASHFVRGLRLGLADFRLAVRVPQDTVFLAYRALDGIRADVAEREGLLDDGASWKRMRAITQLRRADIEEIKTKADVRRHGADAAVTNAERETALRLLQTALLRYSEWCVKNLDALQRLLQEGEVTATRED